MRNAFSRRALLKGSLLAVSASAIASVDGILRLSPATAVPPTWYRCGDYADWDNGLWNRCNPDANDVDGNGVEIGSQFCGSGGYHRIDQVPVWSGAVTNYERRPYSCKNKNAWVWRISDNPATPNPADRRCSDGKYRQEWNGGQTGWHYSVCQVFL